MKREPIGAAASAVTLAYLAVQVKTNGSQLNPACSPR